MTQFPPPIPPTRLTSHDVAAPQSAPARELYCRGCVYPLTSLEIEAGQCPECGRDFDLRRPLTTRSWPRPDASERGRTLVVWVALVLLVTGIAAMQFFAARGGPMPGGLPDPQHVASPFVKVLGKTAIGIESMPSGGGQGTQMLAQLDESATNAIDRLRAVGIAGWIGGPDVALTRLDALDAELAAMNPPEPELQGDAKAMRAIFASTDGTIEPGDRQLLLDRHGWFAEVAMAARTPAGDARRKAFESQGLVTITVLMGAGLTVLCAVVLGVVSLVVLLVQFGNGGLRMRFPWDQAHFEPTRGTLLETITIFLAGFILLQIVAEVLRHFLQIDATHVLMWGLLLVAGWPTLRQLRWKQTRLAIGWHPGRGVLREMGAGIVGYLAGLPIVMMSFVVAMVIISLLHQKPTHPVVDELGKASVWTLLLMFLLATVWAPVVEETMFRGAFYSHLRRVTNPIIAAFVVGFVFAIIHPQGIGLVPPLMTLGAVFALIREWRGSLIGSMTAHALHNGFLVTLMAVLFS